VKTAKLITRYSGELRSYTLSKDTTTIGSAAANDFVLEDSSVSRSHARVDRIDDGFQLVDLESTNGTYVGGRRLHAPHRLQAGDEIRLGRVALRFQAAQTSATAPAAYATPYPIAPEPKRRYMNPAVAALATLVLVILGFGAAMFVINFDRMDRATPGTAPADQGTVPTDTLSGDRFSSAVDSAQLDAATSSLNYYRGLAGLTPVRIDPALSTADEAHARYLVRNYADFIRVGKLGAEVHTEDPSLPDYTPEGAKAAAESDIDEGYASPGLPMPFAPPGVIDDLIGGPFHRMTLLSPRLTRIGYGQYCADNVCAAGVNVNSQFAEVSMTSARTPAPIEFPPNGSHLKMRSFHSEWPNPLSACPGYSAPTGLPITLQLGPGAPVRLGGYSLTLNGSPPAAMESCAFDAGTYVNPDPIQQQRGRDGLLAYGAVVLIPRQPLTAGSYTATIVADRPYTWTFSID